MSINLKTVSALLEIKNCPFGTKSLLSGKALEVLEELEKTHKFTDQKPLNHWVDIELCDILVSAATNIQTLKKANAKYIELMKSVPAAGAPSRAKEILALKAQLKGSREAIGAGETIIKALCPTKLENVDQFLEVIQKLDAWVSEAPDEVEVKARETAAERIEALFLSEEVSDVKLDLGRLGLTSLPDVFSHPIFNLVGALFLNDNHLTAIPSTLTGFNDLQILILRGNPELTSLEDSVVRLPQDRLVIDEHVECSANPIIMRVPPLLSGGGAGVSTTAGAGDEPA